MRNILTVAAIAAVAIVAQPALAKNKGHGDKKIERLNDQLGHVLTTPSDDRRDQIDKLVRDIGFALFSRNAAN